MAYGQVSGGPQANMGAGRARGCAVTRVVVLLLVAAGALAGCSGGGGAYGEALSLAAEESGASPALDGIEDIDAGLNPYELSYKELRDGPAVRYLGMARLLEEVGVIELLGSYIVNVPNGAYFLPNFELQAAMSASRRSHDGVAEEARALRDFELTVLVAVDGDALNRLHLAHEPVRLHEAFFEVFEQCGRDSPWPEVEMAERVGNSAGDVLFRDPSLRITDFEYRELLHVCGRYAATYPTLDPVVRDELLAPQRAYFATELLDRLDDELPVVEIPAKYQAEVDDLRRNGW